MGALFGWISLVSCNILIFNKYLPFLTLSIQSAKLLKYISRIPVSSGQTVLTSNPYRLHYFHSNLPYTLEQMAPTAAAGNSTSGQYKGPGYGSAAGYGSGYDAGADSYKVGSAGGYTGSPAQTKAGGTPTTSTDLTPMYTKGHATLNKVNVSCLSILG